MAGLENLKIRLGIDGASEDDRLSLYLSDAKDLVLDCIGRDALPARLESVVEALAVIAYNREGTEGEASRGEGGLSSSYLNDLPVDLYRRIQNYPRKVRVMGNAPPKTQG